MPVTIDRKDVAFIIPAYNPPSVLESICTAVAQAGSIAVVVDDGSANKDIFGRIRKNGITVLHHRINLGQGAAIETGICKALAIGSKWIITFDADGQHQLSDAWDMLGFLAENDLDIVFGSRFLNFQHAKAVPFVKRYLLKGAAVFEGLMSGIRLSDAHNGLRVMTCTAAATVHFTESRMAHATELLWICKRNGWKYDEWPVHISYTAASQSPLRSLEIALDILLRKLIS